MEMDKKKVIAVFDIGRINKKLLLYDTDLKLVTEHEEKISWVRDDDGFECDDIESIERWLKKSVALLVRSDEWDLAAINFAAYGSSLVYLDVHGKRVGPVYNYLKPIDNGIPEQLYSRYGGKDEFCRSTASPALGMLNSGMQLFWMKMTKPEIFSRVKHILHLPQYFSYIFTGKIISEYTSIGCHTALWDFENMKYHRWLADEGIQLPDPVSGETSCEIAIEGKRILIGTGLHANSSAVVPYISMNDEQFLLLSSGNWCICTNPFNEEVLTNDQLANGCLCYLSARMRPVKSSRLYLGHYHEVALIMMSRYFKIQAESFKLIKPDVRLFNKLSVRYRESKVFFGEADNFKVLRSEPDFFEFDNFVEAYHQLVIELADLAVESMNLVIPENDNIRCLYLKGGFSKNDLFVKLIASSFPHLKVFTTELRNAAALGAALVIYDSVNPGVKPQFEVVRTDNSAR
jgi:hypothetical protein